jgi:hypothetical protein
MPMVEPTSTIDADDIVFSVEEWSNRIQETIDGDKATIEAVHTLMVVVRLMNSTVLWFYVNMWLGGPKAAFIAGVQAQIIAFTLGLEPSRLKKEANFFAFLGLILEIAGTFLGAIHSILLQRRSKGNTDSHNRITQFKADVKVILKWHAKKRSQNEHEQEPASTRHRMGSLEVFSNVQNVSITGGSFMVTAPTVAVSDNRDDYRERLQRVESLMNEIRHYPWSRSQGYIVNAIMKIVHELSPPSQGPLQPQPIVMYGASTEGDLKSVPAVVRRMFALGNIPLYSMAVGVVFLAISTILLAAASANTVGSAVWVTCVGVLVGIMILSFLPLRYFPSLCHFVWLNSLKPWPALNFIYFKSLRPVPESNLAPT